MRSLIVHYERTMSATMRTRPSGFSSRMRRAIAERPSVRLECGRADPLGSRKFLQTPRPPPLLNVPAETCLEGAKARARHHAARAALTQHAQQACAAGAKPPARCASTAHCTGAETGLKSAITFASSNRTVLLSANLICAHFLPRTVVTFITFAMKATTLRSG